MPAWVEVILSFQITIWVVSIVIVIGLYFRRKSLKKKERFEKRKN
tara:strand:+ start:487 stop:621 length:135 start_codon:yes stop_codon:yes gene_type:complete